MFHWKDGWFFERDKGTGDVHIVKRENSKVEADGFTPASKIVAEAFIPPAEWASIVSTVSRMGETGDTWPIALAFHGDVSEPYATEMRRARDVMGGGAA